MFYLFLLSEQRTWTKSNNFNEKCNRNGLNNRRPMCRPNNKVRAVTQARILNIVVLIRRDVEQRRSWQLLQANNTRLQRLQRLHPAIAHARETGGTVCDGLIEEREHDGVVRGSQQPTRINAPGIEFANCESFRTYLCGRGRSIRSSWRRGSSL